MRYAVHKLDGKYQSIGIVGIVDRQATGWRFTSNVASHGNGRRKHDNPDAAVPRWVGDYEFRQAARPTGQSITGDKR